MDDYQKLIQEILDSKKMTDAEKKKAIAELELQAKADKRRQGFKRKT